MLGSVTEVRVAADHGASIAMIELQTRRTVEQQSCNASRTMHGNWTADLTPLICHLVIMNACSRGPQKFKSRLSL